MKLIELSDIDVSSTPAMPVAEAGTSLLPPCTLKEEESFYGEYTWCLNPCLTVREAGRHLARELVRFSTSPLPWQRSEVATNMFLLSSALLNSVDDYLRGPVFQLPRLARYIPGARWVLTAVEKMSNWRRAKHVRQTAAWRQNFLSEFVPFLRNYVVATCIDAFSEPAAQARDGLACAAGSVLDRLPADLLDCYTHILSAFRKLDLSPTDILTLGKELIARFPDRKQPILMVGLRTTGSYFAPLLRAQLESEGFETVDMATFRPDMGVGKREREALDKFADERYLAMLLDDPPVSGETFAHAADILRHMGFPLERIVALFPEFALSCHPSSVTIPLAGLQTITITSNRWHKMRLLELPAVEHRLTEYFRQRGYATVKIIAASAAADQFNTQLESMAEEERRNRLKRVFEVRLERPNGISETRFVLAKSVGAGYLSYHAFLAASRLSEFVPPLLGLRDGLLFSEWIPQSCPVANDTPKRQELIERIASYTAARVRALPLPGPTLLKERQHKFHHGLDLLAKTLSKAYGPAPLAKLMLSRVRRRLAAEVCPRPTLIDGKMRTAEWIDGGGALLKTDFEHHGMGKNEVNIVDPAFDLAEAILQLTLSEPEEKQLLDQYRDASGDTLAPDRLFLNKLLAGLWNMAGAMRNLRDWNLAARQEEFHHEYVRAWDFLTVHAARYCGRLCQPARPAQWASPLVVLDVDGVIDRRIFGFPCTTWAGIQAISLLHAHGLPIALNTARSVAEVKEYCTAYGCVGGIAEYGGYVWDAAGQRGQILISVKVQDQLDRARQALAHLPGVFIHDGYKYSIKANTYEEGLPVPLPTLLVQRFLADYNLDRLTFHQTSIDTTIVAADRNKGTGLLALLAWTGLANATTYVVGDSEPDLAMFRLADRCFAPAHIGCARLARILGCQIAPQSFQRGLLHIARSFVHADGGRCGNCAAGDIAAGKKGLFLDMLRAADEPRWRQVLRALFHPAALEVFRR